MPAKKSAFARGYRSINVQSETIRSELATGARANDFPTTGDYLLYLHREAEELARGKGFSTASEWFRSIREARKKKAQI